MSYNLHVVRTAHWLDADANPITKEDVELLLVADSDLSWSEDYVDMLVDGVSTRFHLIEWHGNPVFWWYKSEIRFNSAEEKAQIKLIEIAKALSAFVVGDDGEHYRLTSDENGQSVVEPFENGQPVVELFNPTRSAIEIDKKPSPISKKSWYKFW